MDEATLQRRLKARGGGIELLAFRPGGESMFRCLMCEKPFSRRHTDAVAARSGRHCPVCNHQEVGRWRTVKLLTGISKAEALADLPAAMEQINAKCDRSVVEWLCRAYNIPVPAMTAKDQGAEPSRFDKSDERSCKVIMRRRFGWSWERVKADPEGAAALLDTVQTTKGATPSSRRGAASAAAWLRERHSSTSTRSAASQNQGVKSSAS